MTAHFVQKTPISEYLYRCHRDESERPFGCDVDVHCDGGFIPCHSAILSASPLLRDHFDSLSPSERIGMVVHMPHFSIEHVTAVINLLYTGKCLISRKDINVTWEILESLNISDSKVCSSSATPEDLKHKSHIRRYLLDSDDDDDDDDENFSSSDDNDDGGGGGDNAEQEEINVLKLRQPSSSSSSLSKNILTEDVKVKLPMINLHPPPPIPSTNDDEITPVPSSSLSAATTSATIDVSSNLNSNLPPPLPTGKIQHQIHQSKPIKVHKDGKGIKIVRDEPNQEHQQQLQQQNDEEMRDESGNCSSTRSSMSRETIVCVEENGQVIEAGTSAMNQNNHSTMIESENDNDNDNDKENDEGNGTFKRKTTSIPLSSDEQEETKRRKINAFENASDEEDGNEEEGLEEEQGEEMSDSDGSSFCDSDIDIPLLAEERQIFHDCKVLLEKLSSKDDDIYRDRLISLQQELLHSQNDQENESISTTSTMSIESEQVTTNVRRRNSLEDERVTGGGQDENDDLDGFSSTTPSRVLRRSSRSSRNSIDESTTSTTGHTPTTNAKLSSSSSPASLPPPILSPQMVNAQVEPMNIDSPTRTPTTKETNVNTNNNSSDMSTTSNQMSSIHLSPINLSSKLSAAAAASTTITVEPFRKTVPMNVNINEAINLSRSPIPMNATTTTTTTNNNNNPRIGQPIQQMITTLPPEQGIISHSQIIVDEQRRLEINMARRMRRQHRVPQQQQQQGIESSNNNNTITSTNVPFVQPPLRPVQQQQQILLPPQVQIVESNSIRIDRIISGPEAAQLTQNVNSSSTSSSSTPIGRPQPQQQQQATLSKPTNNLTNICNTLNALASARVHPNNQILHQRLQQSKQQVNPISGSNINLSRISITPPIQVLSIQGDTNRSNTNILLVNPEPNNNSSTTTNNNNNNNNGIAVDNNNSNPTFLARTTYDGFPIRVYRKPVQSNNNNSSSSSSMNPNVVNVIPVARSSPNNIARISTTSSTTTTTLLNPIQIQRQLENVIRVTSPNLLLNNININTTNSSLNHITNSLQQQHQHIQQIQIQQQRQASPHNNNISIPNVTIQPQLQQERIPIQIPNSNQLRNLNTTTTSVPTTQAPPPPYTRPPPSNERIVCKDCEECFTAESYHGHLCFGAE